MEGTPVPESEWIVGPQNCLALTTGVTAKHVNRSSSPLGASLEVRPSRYALENHSTRESILLYPRNPSAGEEMRFWIIP
jgi:hypothetical protein